MSDIFVSHVEEDAGLALGLASRLETAGYRCWFYERDCLPGPPYVGQVARAIDDCQAVLLVISSASLQSTQVTNEVVRAYEEKKPFVPVLWGGRHVEFQQQAPHWRQCLGAATSVAVPADDWTAIVPRVLAGLQSLGVAASAAPVPPEQAEASAMASSADSPALPGRTVGIDLGTTFSCVAFMDSEKQPVAVPNNEGDRTTPSVVHIEADGNAVVGKSALRDIAHFGPDVAFAVKRDMGCPVFHKPIHGKSYPPEVLSAIILRKLKRDAEASLGPIANAVVTVPAYFDEPRRKATMDAARMAGLNVLEILNEPTAAALAFAWRQGHCSFKQSNERSRIALVYDLGGGTFDCSIVKYQGADFRVLATDGDVRLGGQDWDERLAGLVAEEFITQYQRDPREDPHVAARLWRECEDAKRTLTSRSKASIPVEYQGRSLRMDVTRQQFEEATADLLERTRTTMNYTVWSAGLDWSQVDSLLLVGGSSRMPMIRDMLRQVAGKEPDTSVPCDEAVAQGAAIRAAVLQAGDAVNRVALPVGVRGAVQSVNVQNVLSHSLGVEGRDIRTGRLLNSVLLPRNTPIPATAGRRYGTQKDDQRNVSIVVLEGECPSSSDCAVLGKFIISGLPSGLPAGSPIEVRYHVDENGRLNIEARDLIANRHVRAVIERSRGLSEEQIAGWTRWIAALEL